jgi:transmembrane sensor
MSTQAQHSPEPDEATVDRAIAWLTLLSSGQAGEHEQGQYRQWRAADPQHALAASRLEQMFAHFDGLQASPAKKALDAVAAKKRRPALTSTLTSASASAVAMLAVVLLSAAGVYAGQSEWRVWLADYRTGAGERRTIELADHSRLTLNGESAVDIHYSSDGRRVTLLRGEVQVDVAHIADPASQPFVVSTRDGAARALGTRFIVRRDAGSTLVTVLESAVQASAADSDATQTITAGKQAVVTSDAVSTPHSIDGDQAAAWTGGRLIADNTPLSEVLQGLSHYRRGMLRYDAEQAARLRVSGVFSLDDSDRTLDALQSALPIRVQRYTPLLTVVKFVGVANKVSSGH